MSIRHIVAILLGMFFLGCSEPEQEIDPMHKVELELSVLDENGLRGPAGGKVDVSYEFVIPDTGDCRAEVSRIDPTVRFMPSSKGRIGAKKDECLCVGSTHQPGYQDVLRGLAELPYVTRIIPCYFE
ncbi:MAG: hypothetical protein ACSHX9_04295 [Luteolibacter sp.]